MSEAQKKCRMFCSDVLNFLSRMPGVPSTRFSNLISYIKEAKPEMLVAWSEILSDTYIDPDGCITSSHMYNAILHFSDGNSVKWMANYDCKYYDDNGGRDHPLDGGWVNSNPTSISSYIDLLGKAGHSPQTIAQEAMRMSKIRQTHFKEVLIPRTTAQLMECMTANRDELYESFKGSEERISALAGLIDTILKVSESQNYAYELRKLRKDQRENSAKRFAHLKSMGVYWGEYDCDYDTERYVEVLQDLKTCLMET